MKRIEVIITDLDDTVSRTNNPNTGIIPEEFEWAPNFRGDRFFPEIIKRYGENWEKTFFKLYKRSNLAQKVLRELSFNPKKENNFFLTAGIEYIQKKKLAKIGLSTKNDIFVPKGIQKTDAILKLVRDNPDIKKIIIAEDRPSNINKEYIQNDTQIPVELLKIELSSNSGPTINSL